MKAAERYLDRISRAAIAVATMPGKVLTVLAIGFALTSCGNQQIRTTTEQSSKTYLVSPATEVLTNYLRSGDLKTTGLAVITPSSITGQEEDKQAVALAFIGVLQELRPNLHVVPLAETISAINRAGLASEYKMMFEDYRLTGIFERKTLQKVAKVTGTRYLAQLKLSAFRQESKGRWGFLGIRMMETKSSTIRLFLQIWDSNDGSIVWEGSQESTLAHESIKEEYVSMRSVVEESARDLVAHLP